MSNNTNTQEKMQDEIKELDKKQILEQINNIYKDKLIWISVIKKRSTGNTNKKKLKNNKDISQKLGKEFIFVLGKYRIYTFKKKSKKVFLLLFILYYNFFIHS